MWARVDISRTHERLEYFNRPGSSVENNIGDQGGPACLYTPEGIWTRTDRASRRPLGGLVPCHNPARDRDVQRRVAAEVAQRGLDPGAPRAHDLRAPALAGSRRVMGISTVTAGIMAVRYISSLHRRVADMEATDPLGHLNYSLQLAGLPRGRFVDMQALSGALTGAMWCGLFFGIASLVW